MITVKNAVTGGLGAAKMIFPLAAALFFTGCASFQSGDVLLQRNTLRELLADKNIRPFSIP